MEMEDLNMEEEEPQIYVDNHVTSQQQDMASLEHNGSRFFCTEPIAQTVIKSDNAQAQDNPDLATVEPCSSMITIETLRPEKKKYYSLQIFKFGSISISSSSSSLNDSVPLLDDTDIM
jgi:hypothetical protein